MMTEENTKHAEGAMQTEPPELAWYILCVQSNKEERVVKDVRARVQNENLQDVVTDIIIPTEKITEIKSGKKRIVERRLYPGYIMIRMALTDDVWFILRETPGIGEIAGSRERPMPMVQEEVDRILNTMKQQEEKPKLRILFHEGESVKIKEGPFENFDGVVDDVQPDKGLVRVIVSIFGRDTPVELEYWQVESI